MPASLPQQSPHTSRSTLVYPAVFPLYTLGYIDKVYFAIRPCTRSNVQHARRVEQQLEDC